MEAALRARSVLCVASGDVGPMLRLFVYAQSAASAQQHFLAEVLVQKSPARAGATVKADDASAAQAFADALKGWLAAAF